MIDIRPYDPATLPEMVRIYNDSVRFVPHCSPATPQELAEAFAGVNPDGPDRRGMREEAILAAREADRFLGFIHVGLGFPRDASNPEYGVIRFFCYERGRRDAGQALIDAGESYLRRFPIDRIETADHHHKYPFFQIESSYLSERIDHVQALLGKNGYRAVKGEVILQWPDFVPSDPGVAPVECEVRITVEKGRTGSPVLKTEAFQGETRIGECIIASAGEYASAAEAHEWALTEWLGIEAPFQGRGLGRHLLSRGLREAKERGYRHALISTDWRNDRAFVFYSNFGYHLSDWTYIFGKSLPSEEGDA
jgi:GNAT superfamily N-acetyltransferase